MAHVVQQRSNPPYLLIVFVFLFLISATLATLMWMRYSKTQKDLDQVRESRDKLATQADLGQQMIRQLLEQYDNPAPNQARRTVAQQLIRQIDSLTQAISGSPGPADVAVKEWEALQINQGLAPEVRRLQNSLNSLRDQLAQQNAELDGLRGQVRQLRADGQKMADEQTLQTASLTGEKTTLITKASVVHEEHVAQLDTAKVDLEKARNESAQKLAEAKAKIEELSLTIGRLERTYAALEVKYANSLKETLEVGEVARKSDGEIIRVVEGADVCYIDKGRKHGMAPDLTFAVYDASGVTKTGAGKASLIITKVMEDVSECRYRDLKAAMGVFVGDVIANVAYDPKRTYRFVVEGFFDLYNDGQASAQGTEEVKGLIRRFGGEIMSEINVTTDFVVVGDEPPRPDQPEAGATPQAVELYQKNLKVSERYQQVRDFADKYQVRLLNLSRFLALTGFLPTRTLSVK